MEPAIGSQRGEGSGNVPSVHDPDEFNIVATVYRFPHALPSLQTILGNSDTYFNGPEMARAWLVLRDLAERGEPYTIDALEEGVRQRNDTQPELLATEIANRAATLNGPDPARAACRRAEALVARFEEMNQPDDGGFDPDEPGIGSDLWFCRRIAREHGDVLKYVWKWRAWMAWQPDQGRWVRDDGAAAWSAAKTSVARLLAEAADVAGLDEAKGKALIKASRRFMGKTAMEAALKLAQSEAAIVAEPDSWDADPHLLNCVNGTVDLRAGQLHPHDKQDRITKTTGIMYDADARSDLWERFLAGILPASDVRDYMRRAIGYASIGNVTEHVLHVLWGSGANGKSVLCDAVSLALGEYSVSVPTTLLIANGANEHPTLLTTLRGARFALASETSEGGKFNEAQLKLLTGGDSINARGMRENYSQFRPSHTLFCQTNHRPRVKETTFAFWRRMRLVRFGVTIPPHEQDKQLAQKLKDDLPAILAWIVQGAGEYITHGLDAPAEVRAATEEYQRDEDLLRDFVERFEMRGFTTCEDVHSLYTEWAECNGAKLVGQRTLTKTLKTERGWHHMPNARPKAGFRVTPVWNRNDPLNSSPVSYAGDKPETRVSNRERPEIPQQQEVSDNSETVSREDYDAKCLKAGFTP